jgi:hypothetical protein
MPTVAVARPLDEGDAEQHLYFCPACLRRMLAFSEKYTAFCEEWEAQ